MPAASQKSALLAGAALAALVACATPAHANQPLPADLKARLAAAGNAGELAATARALSAQYPALTDALVEESMRQSAWRAVAREPERRREILARLEDRLAEYRAARPAPRADAPLQVADAHYVQLAQGAGGRILNLPPFLREELFEAAAGGSDSLVATTRNLTAAYPQYTDELVLESMAQSAGQAARRRPGDAGQITQKLRARTQDYLNERYPGGGAQSAQLTDAMEARIAADPAFPTQVAQNFGGGVGSGGAGGGLGVGGGALLGGGLVAGIVGGAFYLDREVINGSTDDSQAVANAAAAAAAQAAQDAADQATEDANAPGTTGAEYNAQAGLAVINAQTAYDNGGTGAGIIVGVVDDGIDTDHRDLDANVLATGFDFVDNSATVTVGSHATSVAGVIAAERNATGMHGVAFGASLLNLRGCDASGACSTAVNEIAQISDFAVTQGARVLNFSLGNFGGAPVFAPSAGDLTSIQAAIDAGIVYVFAAGNEGADFPSGLTALPSTQPTFSRNWLAVAALNEAGDALADFSNQCGDTADWCIAAPGEAIFTTATASGTVNGDVTNYETVDGTSFSAPHVSGALAVLMQLFPTLTSAEVVQLMFDTADDLGAPGVDAVFGHGRLNLGAASAPVGVATASLSGGISGPRALLAGSGFSVSQAYGDSMVAALAGQRLMFLDKYDRGFTIDLGHFAALAEARYNIDSSAARFLARDSQQSRQIDGVGEVRFALKQDKPAWSADLLPGEKPAQTLDRASAEVAFSDGVTAQAQYGERPEAAFGLMGQGHVDADARMSETSFANPYIAFARDGVLGAATLPMGGGVSLKLGAAWGDGSDDPLERTESDAPAMVAVGEVGTGNAYIQAGALVERDRILGLKGTGAFALDGAATTFFAGAGGRLALDGKTDLLANGTVGWTRASLDGQSLVTGADGIVSAAFSAGVERREILSDKDMALVAFSQPLKVETGSLHLDIPVARNLDGSIGRQAMSAPLAPTGREMDMEGVYVYSPGERTRVGGGVMVRMDPGNQQGAGVDAAVLFRLVHGF